MITEFKYFINRHKTFFSVLCLFAVSMIPGEILFSNNNSVFQNTTPQENNEANITKIYLLHSDTWSYNKAVNADAQVLRGNVRFRQDSAYMYCDSAYWYESTNSLDAFGNVKMEQGDTLFVYGDVLYYDGVSGLARLRDNVKMINNDVTLITDSLNFDRQTNIGYFFDWGQITDPENQLSSIYGQYNVDTKESV